MREAELLKEIVGRRAKRRMLTGRRDPTLMLGEGYRRCTRTVPGVINRRSAFSVMRLPGFLYFIESLKSEVAEGDGPAD